ncbi:MAG: hypothetical protein ABF969_00145 [Sporolactobacillus sp.]
MISFFSFSGRVTDISPFPITADDQSSCYQLLSVTNDQAETVRFVSSPSTYYVDGALIEIGDWITGYYDGNAPAPLIYPPQYRALVIAKASPLQNVAVSWFDDQLVSSDGQLKLNLSPVTQMRLVNSQAFTGNPGNHALIALYGAATKSIPAQTTPYRIIILCL